MVNPFSSLPQIIPEDVTDWRFLHHEVEPMYFTENCQPRVSKISARKELISSITRANVLDLCWKGLLVMIGALS